MEDEEEVIALAAEAAEKLLRRVGNGRASALVRHESEQPRCTHLAEKILSEPTKAARKLLRVHELLVFLLHLARELRKTQAA